MQVYILIILFCLGCEWGSFFTLVGERLPKNEKIINGKSHCDNCKHPLYFLDKIPILSYIFLNGRCRYCNNKISPLSTYMEFFTGILFALAYFIFGFSLEFLVAIGIVGMLIIIAATDINYYIIPDKVLVFFSIYFIIIQLLRLGIKENLLQVLSGLLLFSFLYIVMLIGNKAFKKESLGGGDIKMMFPIGLVLTPLPGICTIFIASFLALPISIIALYKKKESIIPFGPFILISFMFIYYCGINTEMIIDFLRLI